MISHIPTFRSKLAEGKVCLGASVTLNDPIVTEILSNAAEFLWIDTEHCPMGMETLVGHLIAARAGGAPALVRVPSSEISVIKRVLDSGAEGLIVPQVRSAEEVETIVQACRYPPKGSRGWGPRRPTNYGERSFDDYMVDANERLFVAVQIEHIDAVRDLDRILAVEGLDAIALGPNDLSGSMGKLCRLDDPEVEAVIQEVVDKARAAGKPVGTGMDTDADGAVRFAEMGMQWIQVGCDFSYMLKFAKELFTEIRGRGV